MNRLTRIHDVKYAWFLMNCLVAHPGCVKKIFQIVWPAMRCSFYTTSFTAVHFAVGPTNSVFAQARHGDLGKDKLVSGDISSERIVSGSAGFRIKARLEIP